MFPKLRFKEFDGDWLKLKYKDVLTIKYGKDHKSLNDGDIPVYGTGGLMRHVNKYLYDGESILIGRKGTIDKPKYINEKFWTVDTLFYTEIEESIVPLFLYQHALEVNWLGLNEATGVPSLNTTSIYNIDISIPSKEEQTKIASFLSNVDEKISQLTQKLELLSQYKQGMMQKLFSQQIRFKADDGSEFGEWEETTIGKITSTISTGATPSTLKEEYWNGNIKWMSSGELNHRHVHDVEKTITELGFKSSSTKILPKHCVLIGLAGQGKTRGTVAINYIELSTNQSIAAIHPNPKVFDYRFIFFNLDMRYQELRALSTGDGGRGGLNLQIIKGVEIHLPCLEEQTKIANFLSSIDQKIEVVAQQIEQAKQWKKGLLQQMFV